MSYQIKLDKRALNAARFISRLQAKIQEALVESGMTQQEVAVALSVDRSVVNRRLKGKANLTARSIADFAFVMNKDIEINLVEKDRRSTNTPTKHDHETSTSAAYLHGMTKNKIQTIEPSALKQTAA